ncbi:EamA family transporter [bacterium]|nr:EamA family transporter [bacterium]
MILTLKLILTALFWGGTFIAARRVVADLGPFSAAFLRFCIANAALLAIGLRRFGKSLFRVPKTQVIPLLSLGLTGIFLYNVFFFAGLKHVEAGRASAIVASNPVFIALLASCFGWERLTARKTAGILMSVSGALCVISRGNPASILAGGLGRGEGFILGCVFSWAAYSLIGKSVLAHVPPLKAVFWSTMIGDVLLMGPAWHEGLPSRLSSMTPGAWIGLFYLGLLGTVLGFVWYYQGVARLGAIRASQFINGVPVSAVALGVLILREPVTVSLIAGTALVICGVTLTRYPENGRGKTVGSADAS